MGKKVLGHLNIITNTMKIETIIIDIEKIYFLPRDIKSHFLKVTVKGRLNVDEFWKRYSRNLLIKPAQIF